MKIPLYQIDAFTSRLFGGNPAAVCPLEDWLDDATEQQALFAEFFKGEYPANTLVEITALAEPGLDVEIEAIVSLS